MASQQEEEALQLLRRADSTGATYYDQLVDALALVISEKPEDPLDTFECAIQQIQAGGPGDTPAPEPPFDPERAVRLTEAELKQQKATRAALTLPEEDEEEPEMPDVFNTLLRFNELGVGLAREETFRLAHRIRALAAAHEFEGLAFFGRFSCADGGHYYVVEAAMADFPQPDASDADDDAESAAASDADESGARDGSDAGEDERVELSEGARGPAPREVARPRRAAPEEFGTGANEKVYWVCKGLDGAWAPLPNARPDLVRRSRDIRRRLSGDLARPCWRWTPPFPGTEADLLRCAVARLHAGTRLVPAGAFLVDDDPDLPSDEEPEVNENEDFDGVADAASLTTARGWVHPGPVLRACGRVALPEPDEEGEEEASGGESDDADEELSERARAAKALKARARAKARWAAPLAAWEAPLLDPWERAAAANAKRLPFEPKLDVKPPPRLAPASDDAPVAYGASGESIPAWVLRRCTQRTPLQVSALASTRWPGAYNMAEGAGAKHAFLYVGDGLPYAPEPYAPPPPPPLFALPSDPLEQSDPEDLVPPPKPAPAVEPAPGGEEEDADEDASRGSGGEEEEEESAD